ncbi:hypothetical protein RGQ29_002424 [Quercus rubra]|uniref:Uncharacterized protein n=1 Tax=Quercus rubra TaxID=3512 RepID=A0AAN7E8Y0_QUERU|nr:hypothetical protein RGQ29_002424 [Quercus rubra]
MKIESLNIQQTASYSCPLVTIILDALDYANVHRTDPNHLHIRSTRAILYMYLQVLITALYLETLSVMH